MHCPRCRNHQNHSRRGATLILAALMMTLMLGMIAFAVDIGYIVLVRTQLQVAADSSAMAAAASMGLSRDEMVAEAQKYAGYNQAGGTPVQLNPDDVEYGTWDTGRRVFTPSASMGNAVRVTSRADNTTSGESHLFFAKIFDKASFPRQASAVAMANPRDIAFVVDLSGSMNNDTEPGWSTRKINDTFGPEGYANIGNKLMQDVYDDFGYGSYPGVVQHIGKPFGVADNAYAYAELTKNGGPLTKRSVPSRYRIQTSDSEATRKRKGYSAIIDRQIANVMPAAKPTPNSRTNYSYWEKYLDYVIAPVRVSGSSGSSRYSRSRRNRRNRRGSSSRGILPPNQDSDRITRMSYPPQPYRSDLAGYGNKIGYLTYVQFMMDHGRDKKPVGTQYTPLSQYSPDCPWHEEDTAGGRFSFPPREQPTHAARRALIAALQVVKERNASITNPNQCDWVSIITFDRLTGGGPRIVQPLTADYDAAMQACTKFQAVSDNGASTATETGMIKARQHIRPADEGGMGRYSTNKIVVLLTDGMPNLYSSSRSDINQFIGENSNDDFYGTRDYRRNAPLMQAMQMQMQRWRSFPVGIGLGTDYGFMDRMARLGGTDNDDGQSPRGSGNPADYEQRLKDIFENIITNPQVRIVQ